MDPRWEALVGVAGIAILFVPVFVMMLGGANRTRTLQEAERQRRLAAYRRSPESQPLKLS
ncbi:MAG TPA: hypothetical protein VN628_12440 [Vicinamibacterales bacterium]|nr:hypothetical protein [Vicinamibacterales bacterium]